MPKIISANVRYSSSLALFDAKDLEINYGDALVVEIKGVQHLAHASSNVKNITNLQIANELNSVIRKANQKDISKDDIARQKEKIGFDIYKKACENLELDMKPIAVKYSLNCDYAIFYFTAANRVDFRQLIKDLSSQLHLKVEMMQIGLRDESKILGGYGHCGQELCCCRMRSEISPVSIKMAKEQNLSLNPSIISGACSRLICCLKYELDIYTDFKKIAPKIGSIIDTPDGKLKLVELDTIAEAVKLQTENGGYLKFPLSYIFDKNTKRSITDEEPVKENEKREYYINDENFDKVKNKLTTLSPVSVIGEKSFNRSFEYEEKLNTDANRDQIADSLNKQEKTKKQETKTNDNISKNKRQSIKKDTQRPSVKSKNNKTESKKSKIKLRSQDRKVRRSVSIGENKQASDSNNSKLSAGNKQQTRPRPGQHSSSFNNN